MNENEIILDNIMNDVMDNIRQLKTKKSTFGGYDRESVMNTIQDICNNYEKHISKIFADNKDHFDMLNAEINDLRQKNEILSRRAATDPAVINKANQAIAEANSRIEAANENISKLQALYEAAETKLKEQEELIAKMSEEIKANAAKKNEEAAQMPQPLIQAVSQQPASIPQQIPPFQQAAPIIPPQTPQLAPNPYYSGQTNCVANPYYGTQPGFINQPFYGAQPSLTPAESSANLQKPDRRDTLFLSQPVIDEAKKTAGDIVKRASEEAERLRQLARNEAEAIVRDRRAEIRAEERLHEEKLDELKEKYAKYSDFFSKMVEGVKFIETIAPPFAKASEPGDQTLTEAPEAVLHDGWQGSFPNQGVSKPL